MLIALTVLLAYAASSDEDGTSASRFGSGGFDEPVLAIVMCPDGTTFVGAAFESVEASCEAEEAGSLDTSETTVGPVYTADTAYTAKDAVLVPTVKDPGLYYPLYGWWVLDGVIVVVEPAEDEAAEEEDCLGDLTVTVSSKTSVGAAIALGTKSDACTLDVVVPDGTHTADLPIDRPTQLRAAKGAAPVVTGALTFSPGAWLVVDGVGLVQGK